VVDFAELLLRCHELLSRNEPLRRHYQERFRHILVDEFQDTNRLQYAWLKLLAAGGACLFAVGDDDQSIYGFRGANVGNLAEFEKEYSKGRVVRLEQNYRSHGSILDAANALISHNKQRLGKNLWTAEGRGEPLRVYAAANDEEEARFVVDEVRQLHREGIALADMAHHDRPDGGAAPPQPRASEGEGMKGQQPLTRDQKLAFDALAPAALCLVATDGPVSMTLYDRSGAVVRRIGHNRGVWPAKVARTCSWKDTVTTTHDKSPFHFFGVQFRAWCLTDEDRELIEALGSHEDAVNGTTNNGDGDFDPFADE
jgi:hypothetical protein